MYDVDDLLFWPNDVRKQALQERYGFKCKCRNCDASTINNSPLRMRRRASCEPDKGYQRLRRRTGFCVNSVNVSWCNRPYGESWTRDLGESQIITNLAVFCMLLLTESQGIRILLGSMELTKNIIELSKKFKTQKTIATVCLGSEHPKLQEVGTGVERIQRAGRS